MTGPRTPRNPKGFGSPNQGKRGWVEGKKRFYTPDQTQRYKSQWARYEKAVRLAQGGPDFVQTLTGITLSGGNEYKYRYYSDGAPKGFWTVTRADGGGNGGGGGGGGGNGDEVYYPSDPAIAFNAVYAVTQVQSFGPDGLVTTYVPKLPYPTDFCGRWMGTANSVSSSGPQSFDVYTPSATDVVSEFTLGQVAGSLTGIVDGWQLWRITHFDNWDGFTGNNNIVFYARKAIDSPYTELPPAVGTAISPSDWGLIAGSPNTICFTDPLPPEPVLPPGDNGGGGEPGDNEWSCDCPDYTKEIEALYTSQWRSERAPRSWADSGAGVGEGGDCKHILATKIYLGITVTPPTDPPVRR